MRPRPRSTMLAILMAALLGCGEEGPRALEQRIINGEACDAGELPSALAILIEGKLPVGPDATTAVRMVHCTGTLIAPDVALTAAHCVHPVLTAAKIGFLSEMKLYVSFAPDLSALAVADPAARGSGEPPALPPDAREVSAVVAHPAFDVSTMAQPSGLGNLHDIGLLFLAKPLAAAQARPAILITKQEATQLAVGTSVVIAGWGLQAEPAGFEPPAKGTFGVKRCAASAINELGPHEMQIGAGPETPRKCHGDSGGPSYASVETDAASTLRVVGITSHAYDETGCAKGGIDTRVDAWLEWVDQEMKDACTKKLRQWCEVPGVIPPRHYDPKERQQPPSLDIPADRTDLVTEEDRGGCAVTGVARSLPWSVLVLALPLLARWSRGARSRSVTRPAAEPARAVRARAPAAWRARATAPPSASAAPP